MDREELKEYERIFAKQRTTFDNCNRILDQWRARIGNELKNGEMTLAEYRRELEQIQEYNNKVSASLAEYMEVLDKLKNKAKS